MRTIQRDLRSFIVNDPPSYPEFWDLFARGEWEPETFDILNEFVKKDTTYVDIGAWIGPTVLYASDLCMRAVAFEPDPVAYQALLTHIGLNSIKNVTPKQIAITDRPGDIAMGSEALGNSESRIGYGKNIFHAECSTLTSILWREATRLFIKIDVEGGEEAILRSSLDFLQANKPMLYVSLHPWLYPDAERVDRLVKDVAGFYNRIKEFHNSVLFLPENA
jgi:FkbM family methyltransferase